MVNQSGCTFDEILVTPHKSKDWGDAILGKDSLDDGEKVQIVFRRKEKAKVWNLRAEDEQVEDQQDKLQEFL